MQEFVNVVISLQAVVVILFIWLNRKGGRIIAWPLLAYLFLSILRRLAEPQFYDVQWTFQHVVTQFLAIVVFFLFSYAYWRLEKVVGQIAWENSLYTRLLDIVASTIGGGVWEWTPKQDKMLFSPSLEEMLGYEAGEMDASNWKDYVFPDDLEPLLEVMRREDFSKYSREFRLKAKDGKYIWVHGNGLPTQNSSSSLSRSVGVVLNINERKAYEEAHTVTVNMDLLLHNLEMGSWMWELESDQITWDRGAKKIYGLPDGYKAQDCLDLIHPDDLQSVEQAMADLKKGKTITIEYRYIKGAKYYYLRCMAGLLGEFRKRGKVITGITIDLTEQRLQKELLQLQKELLEQKNKEMESFLHIASHDLQEPLRKIIYYCQRLRLNLRIDGKFRDYAQWAAESASRMQQLISDLLDYSRAGNKMNESKFTLSDLMGVVHSNLLATIEDNNAIITVDSDVTITGDRNLWEQLMQNLVSNGLKYHRDGMPPLIKISGSDDGRKVIVTVEDNGIGVPWEYRERIFEPFKRLHAKAKYSGTGMGLALCKRITEKHQGRIWLEKTGPLGSTFRIEVPRRPFQ